MGYIEPRLPLIVTPAHAGVPLLRYRFGRSGIPACAGM